MDTEDRLPAASLRSIYRHLAIKATRTQKCRVKDVRTVGRGQDYNGLARLETIHLDEYLLESMLTLIVASNCACPAARPPNDIDLINENNARTVLARLFK